MEIIGYKINRKMKSFEDSVIESQKIITRSIDLVLNHNEDHFVKVISSQLRLLICDNENSLLPRLGKKIPFYKLNDKQDFGVEYSFVNPKDMFNKKEQLDNLSNWLDQEVIITKFGFSFPKIIHCKFCKKVNYTEQNQSMQLRVTGKAELLTFNCSECGKQVNDFDVTQLHLDTLEGDLAHFPSEDRYTIRHMIKGFANKNGGAHLDPSLDLPGFFAANSGKDYIIGLGIYIIECIEDMEL